MKILFLIFPLGPMSKANVTSPPPSPSRSSLPRHPHSERRSHPHSDRHPIPPHIYQESQPCPQSGRQPHSHSERCPLRPYPRPKDNITETQGDALCFRMRFHTTLILIALTQRFENSLDFLRSVSSLSSSASLGILVVNSRMLCAHHLLDFVE